MILSSVSIIITLHIDGGLKVRASVMRVFDIIVIDNQSQLNQNQFGLLDRMVFVSQEKATLLKQYQYGGGTDSPTYKYLWSPLANKILRFVPLWMAPNVITSIGLCELLVTHLIFMWPDENDEIPFWKFAMVALSIVAYQQIDNLDGKQARRTESSTPLGMMFDHGVDSFVAYTLGLQAMKALRLEYEFQFLMVPIFLMSIYFACMWSQYCVGYFKLGAVNPVDQGLPAYALMFLVMSQIDGATFRTEHWLGTYAQQFMYLLIIPLIPTLYLISFDVFRFSSKPISEVSFMTLLYFSSAGMLMTTVWSIDNLDYKPIVFYGLYYATMFMWCRNIILIQLQSIIKQKYIVFNRGTVSYIVICLVYVVGRHHLPVSEQAYFLLLCGVQTLLFFEFVVRAFMECAQVLGIRIFSLEKPNSKQN